MQNPIYPRRRKESDKDYIKRLKGLAQEAQNRCVREIAGRLNRAEAIEAFIKQFVKFVEESGFIIKLYEEVKEEVFDHFYDEFRDKIIGNL